MSDLLYKQQTYHPDIPYLAPLGANPHPIDEAHERYDLYCREMQVIRRYQAQGMLDPKASEYHLYNLILLGKIKIGVRK
jgi:hypothetical protein